MVVNRLLVLEEFENELLSNIELRKMGSKSTADLPSRSHQELLQRNEMKKILSLPGCS